jgi:hypothetical protein
MSENFEVHLRTVDSQDQTTQPEREAYTRLARETRQIAGQLSALAAEMAGYRDLPMGRHDPAALSSRPIVEAFSRFLKAEQELCALLESSLKRGQQMLAQAQAAPEASRH